MQLCSWLVAQVSLQWIERQITPELGATKPVLVGQGLALIEAAAHSQLIQIRTSMAAEMRLLIFADLTTVDWASPRK